jgi:hypothetical protein
MVAGSAGVVVVAAMQRRPVLAAVPVLGYLAGAAVVAWRMSDEPGVAPHRVLGALAICHWSYGLGFWAGIGRIVRGRGFDHRPRGRRV